MLGEPEVADDEHVVALEEEIVGLQVAVHHVVLLDFHEAVHDLAQVADRHFFVEPAGVVLLDEVVHVAWG